MSEEQNFENELIDTDFSPIEENSSEEEMVTIEEPVSGNIAIGDSNCHNYSLKDVSPLSFRYFITKKNSINGVIADHILDGKLFCNLVDIDEFDISDFIVRNLGDVTVFINIYYISCQSKLREDYLAFLMPKMAEHFSNPDNTFVAEDNIIILRSDETDIDNFYRSSDEICYTMYDLRSAKFDSAEKDNASYKNEE